MKPIRVTESESTHRVLRAGLSAAVAAVLLAVPGTVWGQQSSPREFLDRHCTTCHNESLKTAGLDLAQADVSRLGAQYEVWEKVVRKLHTGVMPPPGAPQPSPTDRRAMVQRLETSLDAVAAANPNPGRTETLRRLNRSEYQNAVRDLLALDIDAAALLPADESGHGFDNVLLGDLTPTLLNRYISAAQKVSRLAVGSAPAVENEIFQNAPDLTQESRLPGMPLGTRGGLATPYVFPQGGEYDIQVYLSRNFTGEVSGLREDRPHELLVLLDRKPVKTFTIQKPANGDDTLLDKDLKVRVPVDAGPHSVAVTFVQEGASLIDTLRQPPISLYNDRRYPRTTPGINMLSVTGPYAPAGAGDTPSRQRLFVCRPAAGADKSQEEKCAREILSTLLRRAYRRPIGEADVDEPLAYYRQGRAEGDFDAGITTALSAVLANPEFLFRVESDPESMPANGVYRISDLELASRLSFFLWSSIPDDELLDAAIAGKLSQPGELEKQTRRMLADRRSFNLATNFAGQWLRLRNLDSVIPSSSVFRDFDDNLRQAFREETQLFFDSVLREDRSVRTFIRSDYTFLNERLAKHYGIPDVYGSRMRRVTLAPDSRRGGLLRQGSVLTVTSYATRTSPVIRGKWILENMIGTPPPPPLPNVPALKDNTVSANLSVRARLAEHRANAACASCHNLMDPIGFSLENFDAIGRWRTLEDGLPIDATGGLPDGSKFAGVAGLEDGLLKRPDIFVSTLTEKLLTFALGRGVESYDAPAVRKIVREARANNYRFSSIILGIVNSTPFTMRKTQ
jgi:Protein of unknown function (DUF1592)/Protein of unknown function (DUF1588)/Protein of unknown function (DUF1585)/Protein of unknown function (DUF1595)/Protein of unknown function (DUF1587)/Planctomycete cytochrome C